MDIEIKSNDRVFVCGMTGSGKSHFLLNMIVPRVVNIVVYDYKNEIELPGFDIFTNIQDFKKYPNRQKIIYRTKTGSDEEFDRLCKQVFLRGNTTLYIDEVADHSGSNKILRYHNNIMRIGRSKGIGCINCTQRPIGVSNNIISQCEHFFIFRLFLDADRKKLAQFCGNKIYEPLEEEHSFYYYRVGMKEPILCRPIKG